MEKKIFYSLLLILMILLGSFTINFDAKSKSSNSAEIVTNNIEALLLIDPLGRLCYDGCHYTGSAEDACEQCGESQCYTYLAREPIGSPGNCPVHPE